MKRYTKYVKRAKELGAKAAKAIRANSVSTGEWVRFKCRFGCAGYGRTLTCPPNSPTPEETKRMLADYTHAILIHGDEHSDVKGIVPVLEREIFLDGHHKAFGMGTGPCRLCPKCGKTCKHPYDARPAMEACGIDVFGTARANGFPIKVLTDETCEGNYFGLVLIE